MQKDPLEHGNSVFVDEHLQPWLDEWSFLARLSRLSRLLVEPSVNEAEHQGRIFGVRVPSQEEDDPEP